MLSIHKIKTVINIWKQLKPVSAAFVFLSAGFFPLQISAQSKNQKPNIILIMTDDQGYGDLGFTGNPYVKTPNIDKLAARSTRLTNYHHSPVCAPTRASLMTGKYHQRTGVHDTYNNGATLATEETTIAEILSENGYKTGIVGKWHLGDDYPFRPSDQGFQYSYVHRGGGIGQPSDPVENYLRKDSSYFNSIVYENNKELKAPGYCTDAFTDVALDFIKTNSEKPFFLYVTYNAPHDPLQVPQKYYDQYKDLKFDSPLDTQQDKAWSKMTDQNKESARRVYAMVSNIDDNVGRILAQLKTQKLEDNTIVIFTTDNGNQQLRYNTGFRGMKGSVYEGGVHVPFFISAKNIPQNKEIDKLIAHIDILPTLLDAASIKTPATSNIDGKSAWPLIQGNTKDFQERLFFNGWHRGWLEPYRSLAVYKGDYKLVAVNADGNDLNTFELFNLKKDPYEQTNLANTEAPIARSLKKSMDSLYAEISASPNLSPRRIELGTSFENPVFLTRQDWAGVITDWNSEQAEGIWQVRIKEDGFYDFEIINTKAVKKGTRVLVRLGQVQRSKILTEESNKTTLEKIYLKKGDYDIESWYEYERIITSPYALSVTKK